MADVRPFPALHYNLDAVGGLDPVAAPPYDVIDSPMRAELVGRSPHNVVRIDLPEDAAGGDIYEHAAGLLEGWKDEGVLVDDGSEALWALEQAYTGPDGAARTRRGFLARIRVSDYGPGRIRPHERTQPGPKEDRLRLTRATRHNLSPIFVLSTGEDAMGALDGALDGEPWGTATDADGTVNRVWRVSDDAACESVRETLADSELLIADGHHRYETARTYADEVGGDGAHRYTLACVVSLEDPGLEVFGYHRMLTDLKDPERQQALGATIKELFEVDQVSLDELDPAGTDGLGVFGYIDAHHRTPYRLRLKSRTPMDEALAERSEAYRELDAAILETLLLRGPLGLSAADVEAKKGLAYTADADAALSALDGDAGAVFLMRPTPVEAVRAVADAGETMPPKSTYFFPKLLTGIVFNPLS